MKEANKVVINEKNLTCHHCGNEKFYEHSVKMNKTMHVIFDVEWASKSGKAFVCDACGFKMEFFPI